MTRLIPSIIAAFALAAVPAIAQASPPKRSSSALVGTSGTASAMKISQADKHDSKLGDKDRFKDKDRDEDRDERRHCDRDEHKCKKPPSPR